MSVFLIIVGLFFVACLAVGYLWPASRIATLVFALAIAVIASVSMFGCVKHVPHDTRPLNPPDVRLPESRAEKLRERIKFLESKVADLETQKNYANQIDQLQRDVTQLVTAQDSLLDLIDEVQCKCKYGECCRCKLPEELPAPPALPSPSKAAAPKPKPQVSIPTHVPNVKKPNCAGNR